MASEPGAGETDELIDRKLQRSGQLHEAMAQTLALDDEGLEVIDLHGTDVATTAISNSGPDAAIAAKLSDAPSNITAISRSCFALNAIPGCQRSPGCQTARMTMPRMIARTITST